MMVGLTRDLNVNELHFATCYYCYYCVTREEGRQDRTRRDFHSVFLKWKFVHNSFFRRRQDDDRGVGRVQRKKKDDSDDDESATFLHPHYIISALLFYVCTFPPLTVLLVSSAYFLFILCSNSFSLLRCNFRTYH